MRDRGIAVIRVGEEEMAVFDECYGAAKAYFEGRGVEEKEASKMGTENDWGYVEMPGIKEFWQMRHGAHNPFGETSARFFGLCTEMGRTCLAALARGMMVPEERMVDNIVDPLDAPLSSTIFRFFHYYATKGRDACQVHTDIGLLTLIPASTLPSLEVMDFDEFDWYNFERPLQRNDVMVLCGETLERLTAYYFRAVVHRVCPTLDQRYSLVYLMRARPDAMLDAVALQSPLLGTVYHDMREPISVAKFMRLKYLNKKSANFVDPGQGLPMANLQGEAPTQEEIDHWKGKDNY